MPLDLALNLAFILIATALLWKGADLLVDSATRIARSWGVSDLVIGLTVVACGTSAPELVVSVSSSYRGLSDIAIANVVGSNIFNLGIILGGCACYGALTTTPKLVFRDGGILIGATVLLRVFIHDGTLGAIEGAVFLALLLGYLALLFVKREPLEDELTVGPARGLDYLLLFMSLGAVIGGGELMLRGAVFIARIAGLSEWVIGLTIIAAATSLPEFVTSLIAARKGRAGLAIGNLIGSNIFNILGILGVAALCGDLTASPTALETTTILCGQMLIVVMCLRTAWQISSIEGALLILLNVAIWARDLTRP